MSNETIGRLIVTIISLLSVVGISCTLYSLLCEKDSKRVVRKKPASHYPVVEDEKSNSVILYFD